MNSEVQEVVDDDDDDSEEDDVKITIDHKEIDEATKTSYQVKYSNSSLNIAIKEFSLKNPCNRNYSREPSKPYTLDTWVEANNRKSARTFGPREKRKV